MAGESQGGARFSLPPWPQKRRQGCDLARNKPGPIDVSCGKPI
jgi:hypothetical protein